MNLKNAYQFTNKVAFVTGAATGIGRASAIAYAQNGAQVCMVDVNIDEALKTLSMIKENGGVGHFIKCDVSSSEQVEGAIKETMQKFGRIDFAFNNAGIEGKQGSTADCTEENWDKVINVNLKSIWLCMKYQIPYMLKQGGGAIVNCSSIAGIVGFQGSPAYVASKHGVIGLTKTAALEFAKQNIRVNAISPGVIHTPMIDRYVKGDSKLTQALSAGEPIGRMGEPNEIASAALWLSSDQSSFVTGHTLVVDGGWVAQ